MTEIKPVAWLHVAGMAVVTDRNRADMSALGKREYSKPLYSAPAPELVAELREMIDLVEGVSEGGLYPHEMVKLDAARALLARIEGEQK